MKLTISKDVLEQASFSGAAALHTKPVSSSCWAKKGSVEEQALLQQIWVFVELAPFSNVEF